MAVASLGQPSQPLPARCFPHGEPNKTFEACCVGAAAPVSAATRQHRLCWDAPHISEYCCRGWSPLDQFVEDSAVLGNLCYDDPLCTRSCSARQMAVVQGDEHLQLEVIGDRDRLHAVASENTLCQPWIMVVHFRECAMHVIWSSPSPPIN